MCAIAVKFLPDATQLRLRELTSVPGVLSVQAAHVLVSIGGVEQEHVVVNAHPGTPDRATCLAIVGEISLSYPSALVSVLLSDSPGTARCFTKSESIESIHGIAAAVACMKAVLGWDESQTFQILVNNHGSTLTVTVLDGNAWSLFAFSSVGHDAPPSN